MIDPKAGKLVKVLPIENCHPAGLAFGPNGNFILGCNADGKQMPAATSIMNAKTGAVVAVIPGIGGADMVNYNAKNGQYYTASRGNPGGPVLGVIDAASNTLVQTIRSRRGAAFRGIERGNRTRLRAGRRGRGGDGTIHVFAPSP